MEASASTVAYGDGVQEISDQPKEGSGEGRHDPGMPSAERKSVAPRSTAHLIAEIRAQLDQVGLRHYRESLRLVGAKDQLGAIEHAVEGARHVVEFHFASCSSSTHTHSRRELVLTLKCLHENVLEALRQVG